MRWLALAFGAAMIASKTGDALAFIDPPVLDPDTAQVGQIVNLRLRTGLCHGVLGGKDNPAITVDGAHIDVLIDGVRNFDPLWCFFSIVDHAFPISSLEAGTYTVTVRFRYTPFGLSPVIELLDELPLSVIDRPQAQSVPIDSASYLAILGILILLGATYACRNRI